MYYHWYNTHNLYVAALKYLSGVNVVDLYVEYPHNKWKLMHMHGNFDCCSVADLNRNIAMVCCEDESFFSDYIGKLNELYEMYGGAKTKPPIDPMTFRTVKERREYCYRYLQDLVRYRGWFVYKEFPAVLKVSTLANVLFHGNCDDVNKAIHDCRETQTYTPGGHTGLSADMWAKIETDEDLFNTVFEMEGTLNVWPSSVIDKKNCFLNGEKVRILIDGENFRSATADYFLSNDISLPNAKDVLVHVFDDTRHTHRWDLCAKRSPFSMEVTAVPKIVERKSVVDTSLRDEVGKYYYRDGVREFCIMSSDSDFVNLVDAYPDAKFIFVCSRSATSKAMCSKIISAGSFYRFYDESLLFRNEKVYATERLIMHALEEGRELLLSSYEFWDPFCKKYDINPKSSIARSARYRLMNGLVD